MFLQHGLRRSHVRLERYIFQGCCKGQPFNSRAWLYFLHDNDGFGPVPGRLGDCKDGQAEASSDLRDTYFGGTLHFCTLPHPDTCHHGIYACRSGSFEYSTHCLQHCRKIRESTSGHRSCNRFGSRLSGFPDGASPYRPNS